MEQSTRRISRAVSCQDELQREVEVATSSISLGRAASHPGRGVRTAMIFTPDVFMAVALVSEHCCCQILAAATV